MTMRERGGGGVGLQAGGPTASSCSLISSSTIPNANMEVEWQVCAECSGACYLQCGHYKTSNQYLYQQFVTLLPCDRALLITGVGTGPSQRWVLRYTSPDPCHGEPCCPRSLQVIACEAISPFRKPGRGNIRQEEE